MAPKETGEIIEEFLEDQFTATSRFFLYKDKRLLKRGDYAGYAQEQLKKGRFVFWNIVFVSLLCGWYGANSLIEYGSSPNTFDLVFGIGSWVVLIAFLVYASKEYYTIKSSMSLLLKLLDEDKN